MRIVSLVPHATELLFELGAGAQVVAVTHECDHPAAVRELTRVTHDILPSGLAAGEIDAAVRARTAAGESIYELDVEALAALEPDLIVTQALCSVCAVSHDQVTALAAAMPSRPRVVALDPRTLEETLADAATLGAVTGHERRAAALVAAARMRLQRVRSAVAGCPRPRVAALEWLDPVFVGGHWVPEMITLAGGQDPLGVAGRPSRRVSWEQVERAQPELVVVMPCGYDAPRAQLEADAHAERLARLGARAVIAVDACACFSRPGPRLLDGVELLARALHGEIASRLPASAAG